MVFVKKIIIFAIIAAVCYFLFSYHYIMNGFVDVRLLKKSSMTLKYTVYNVKGKDPERILKIKELRDDGIGEVLVDMGVISEEKLAGLIVIDQDWYLDTKNYDTLGCGVEINLMDDRGTVLFNSKPGLTTDGETKLTNLMQDFLSNLTFSIAGTPGTDDIQAAIDEVSSEMADSIVQRLQDFAPRQ